MEAIPEPGRDPEVAATATECPEQVGLAFLGGGQQSSVRRDDIDLEETVDRHPVLAHQPAHATAERETGDADGRHVAAGRRQSPFVRAGVVLTPGETGFGRCHTPIGIDVESFHRRKVDDEPEVDRAVPGRAVPTAPHRQGQVVAPGEADRLDDVGDLVWTHDQRRPAVDGQIPDPARRVVLVVAGLNDLSPHPRCEGTDRGLREGRACPDRSVRSWSSPLPGSGRSPHDEGGGAAPIPDPWEFRSSDRREIGS